MILKQFENPNSQKDNASFGFSVWASSVVVISDVLVHDIISYFEIKDKESILERY